MYLPVHISNCLGNCWVLWLRQFDLTWANPGESNGITQKHCRHTVSQYYTHIYIYMYSTAHNLLSIYILLFKSTSLLARLDEVFASFLCLFCCFLCLTLRLVLFVLQLGSLHMQKSAVMTSNSTNIAFTKRYQIYCNRTCL